MPFFRFLREKYLELRRGRAHISAQQLVGSWLRRYDDEWIFFAFYEDGVCEYTDDTGDVRIWHYELKHNRLELWGADKNKAVPFELGLNGDNLVINGTEYRRSEKVWRDFNPS